MDTTINDAHTSARPPQVERDIPLDLVDVDPEQPRRIFDEGKLAELAHSIRAHGVQSRIKVRPHGDRYLVVFGERRLRASRMVGVDLEEVGPAPETIPAVIEVLTDAEVRKLQLIENGQRADLHPLEEADHFNAMIEKDGETARTIAAKIHKSPAYVYAKLKLCSLSPTARKALLEGRLSESHAIMIARIPGADLQERATKEILGEAEWQSYEHDVQPRELDVVDGKGKVAKERQPLSVKQAQVHLQRRYMLRLELAKFPTDDAELVKAAGACGPCPHRTGNQRDLFGDVRGADVCTNPSCYADKNAAQWDREAASAMRDGKRVLSDKEAKAVFDASGTRVSYSSPYVDPTAELPFELQQRSGKKTFAALIGNAVVAKVLVKDGAGAARTLLDRKSVEAAAIKSGDLKPEPKKKPGSSSSAASHGGSSTKDFKEERRKAARALLVERRADAIAYKQIAEEASETLSGTAERSVARHVAVGVARLAAAVAVDAVVQRRGLVVVGKAGGAEIKALEKHVETLSALQCRGLVVELLAAGGRDDLKAAAELLGVELKAAKAEAAAAVKAEEAEATKAPEVSKRTGKGGK